MLKHLTIVVFGFMLISITGCKLQTPEIRGVVLDAETKEPVEGAWVRASLEIQTKTVGGDVHSDISLDKPHTRTDKQGKFIIPSKTFKKPPIPIGFGTKVLNLAIGASTVDDRGGRINYFSREEKHYTESAGEPEELLSKDSVEITIYVKPFERTESEYFNYLQHRYNYCLTGRSSVETPAVEGGCDDWELNYAITKHERYIERIGEPDPKSDRGGRYTGALNQLGHLLKKRGNYRESLEAFKKLKEFSKKRKTESLYTYEFDIVMPELEQLLKKQ